MTPKRIGIVLFQLGGPDSPAAVRPFLYNLFCDPDILPLGPLGALLRKPLAWYIARRRAEHAAHHYDHIGGSSPIRLLTERQARALDAALRPDFDPTVVIAMRYWHPFTAAALAQLAAAQLDEVVLLPLYPQYSLATTASSLKEWNRLHSRSPLDCPVRTIEKFYDHPQYLAALVERINLSLSHFDDPRSAHLLFSAHGLPLSLLAKGDPYKSQIESTLRLVLARGAWPNPHSLGFQSKVGRAKWLEPSLNSTITRLAAEGVRNLLVIPISFVTEHVETLNEVNLEARAIALSHGVEQFEMMPALGDSPLFISALADLVRRALTSHSSSNSRLQIAASAR